MTPVVAIARNLCQSTLPELLAQSNLVLNCPQGREQDDAEMQQ
jgi:hypothetical protein